MKRKSFIALTALTALAVTAPANAWTFGNMIIGGKVIYTLTCEDGHRIDTSDPETAEENLKFAGNFCEGHGGEIARPDRDPPAMPDMTREARPLPEPLDRPQPSGDRTPPPPPPS